MWNFSESLMGEADEETRVKDLINLRSNAMKVKIVAIWLNIYIHTLNRLLIETISKRFTEVAELCMPHGTSMINLNNISVQQNYSSQASLH